jgi:two-component system response regulator HydG
MEAAALVIDDDADLLDTIRRNAADEGLEVYTALSWEEGLALFQTASPDLVIADYNLQDSQHGLRLLLEVKLLRPSVRVVLISGVVNPDELDKVMQLGVVDRVLSKGTAIETMQALLDEIRRATERWHSTTDWPSFARALVERRTLTDDLINDLDDRLRSQAERGQ